MRIGTGYDVHTLCEGRRLVLGGVEIPHPRGLDGHSDADVLTHAVVDALLGAAALGDIGMHFPPSDMQYKDLSSMLLLRRCGELLREQGYRIENIDSTLVAQAPRLSPYIPRMQENIALALGIDLDRVSVKATTEEGLGFTGKGLGIAAQAAALIEKV